MIVDIDACCDLGRVRTNNEDMIRLQPISRPSGTAITAASTKPCPTRMAEYSTLENQVPR